jgi:biopolymer transport protein TolR
MAGSRRSSRRGGRLVNEINVVPYIDVMLVLLVIFMTTAAFVPTGVVDLPRAGAAPTNAPPQYIEIIVKQSGDLTLKTNNMPEKFERSIPLRDLPAQINRLRGISSDVKLVVSADKQVPYEKVTDVVRTLHDNGGYKVALNLKRG